MAVNAYETGFANMREGDICPSHPTGLGIAVNFPAAYHALNSPTRAFEIATVALDVAAAITTPAPDETEKILTLLRQNLRSCNEVGPLPQEQNLTVRTSGITKSLSEANQPSQAESVATAAQPFSALQDDIPQGSDARRESTMAVVGREKWRRGFLQAPSMNGVGPMPRGYETK